MSIIKLVNVFGCLFVGLLGSICCVSLVGVLLSISYSGFTYGVGECIMLFFGSFILMGFVGLVWCMIIHPEYFEEN